MIEIEEKRRCCGCEACRQVCPQGCIRMERDEEGFDYPIVDTDRCIECHKCERVCPFMKLDEPREPQAVYAACATDEGLREASSSGGLFTLLAEDTLRRGGVVFGARFDEAWSVCHDYTETIEGLAPFRGSKYLQSRIGRYLSASGAVSQRGATRPLHWDSLSDQRLGPLPRTCL